MIINQLRWKNFIQHLCEVLQVSAPPCPSPLEAFKLSGEQSVLSQYGKVVSLGTHISYDFVNPPDLIPIFSAVETAQSHFRNYTIKDI